MATRKAAAEPLSAAQLLSLLAGALSSGGVRVVDLTQTLAPEFPQIALPPEMGQCWPFRIEEVSRYDERGPGWYWNNFSCGEHTGHALRRADPLDLRQGPAAWIGGHDSDASTSSRRPCVVDCSAQGRGRPRLLAQRGRPRGFRGAQHGRIAAGPWLLMRTDWSKRWTRDADALAYQNFDETGQHTPGPSSEAVRFLVEQRQVLGFGSEAIGTDAGQARTCARRTRAIPSCTARAATGCSA